MRQNKKIVVSSINDVYGEPDTICFLYKGDHAYTYMPRTCSIEGRS